jgi:hypothetical protein
MPNIHTYIHTYNVSKTGFCLRLEVKPEQDDILDIKKTMNNVQKRNICRVVEFFSFLPIPYFPLHSSVAYTNQSNAPFANEGQHMIIIKMTVRE